MFYIETVNDFMNMFIDADAQKIAIYDSRSNTTVFSGFYRDCPESIRRGQVESLDNLIGANILTINICLI